LPVPLTSVSRITFMAVDLLSFAGICGLAAERRAKPAKIEDLVGNADQQDNRQHG